MVGCHGKNEEVFFVCARGRQGRTAGVEILSGGLEMPVLVDSAEACTSELTREVYTWDLLCQVVRGSIGF